MNNSYFLAKIRYTKHTDEGTLKRVNEHFLFWALTFTDSEARVYEELGEIIRGEMIIQALERKDFADIFQFEDCETWWLAKVEIDTTDADSNKKKKVKNSFLVTAGSAKQAAERLKECLSDTMFDYHITHVSEQHKLQEIFPQIEEEIAEESN